jgi:hypothetical protein
MFANWIETTSNCFSTPRVCLFVWRLCQFSSLIPTLFPLTACLTHFESKNLKFLMAERSLTQIASTHSLTHSYTHSLTRSLAHSLTRSTANSLPPSSFTHSLPPSLTQSFTPYSTVLLEKLTGLQPVKKFPAIYGTRWFIITFTITRHRQWGTEWGVGGSNPSPPKFQSFYKAEPNSQFHGIYVHP